MSATNLCQYPNTSCAGKMPRRTRYIPASAGETALSAVQMLNGSWRYRQYTGSDALPPDFFCPDFPDAGYEAAAVPCVQPQTENAPAADRVFLHSFFFRPDRDRAKTYLVFEAVDQAFCVWLNGSYIGCSRSAHCFAEFDISGLVTEGQNHLALLLPAENASQFSEFQGIYGDVYLLKRPENHIWDYSVSTEIGSQTAVRLRLTFAGASRQVSARLLDAEKALVAENVSAPAQNEITLPVDAPRLWSPDQPYRYTLLAECGGEQLRIPVSLRKVTLDGENVLLNGRPLTLQSLSENRLQLKHA